MNRLLVALAIGAAIYGLALGAGTVLYASGTIATGATHNDCAGFKQQIADERGISKGDVPQGEVKARTETCLEGHEISKGEAFRSEYLFWSAWPAAVCALVFLAWPVWARILHGQELADPIYAAGSETREAGGNMREATSRKRAGL